MLIHDNLSGISTPTVPTERVHKLVNSFNFSGLFSGAGGANQGIAHLVVGGQRKVFVTLVGDGPTYTTTEKCIIIEFNVSDNGGALTPVAYSTKMSLGHGQDLGAEVVGGSVILWTTSPTTVDGTGAGKGFSRVTWNGSATDDGDVETFLVCGASGSGHRRENLYQGSVGLSDDGRYLILVPEDTDIDRGHKVLLFDKAEVIAAADPLDVEPVHSFSIRAGETRDSRIVQGVAAGRFDGIYTVAIGTGYYNPFGWTSVQLYSLFGTLLDEISVCPVQADIGLEDLLDHPTYDGMRIELEGMAFYNDEILVGIFQQNFTGSSIVSYEGQNFAYIGTGATVSPNQMPYWARSTKTAADGAYSSGATYTVGTLHSVERKLYSVRPPRGVAGETPISPLNFSFESDAEGSVDDTVSLKFGYGYSFKVSAYSENLDTYFNALNYNGQSFAVYDLRFGSDNTEAAIITRDSSTDGLTFIRGQTDLATGAGINLYDVDHSTAAGQVRLYAIDPSGPTTRTLTFRGASPAFYPGTDNLTSNGLAAFMWGNVCSYKYTLKDGIAAPSAVSGTAQLYADTADGKLKYINGSGVIRQLGNDPMHSAVASAALTGTTTETALATITIPGGAVGPNGYVAVEAIWSYTNSGNTKTMRVRAGGIAGTQFLNLPVTTQASTRRRTRIENVNSQSSQKGWAASATADYGNTTLSIVTASVDTSSNWDISITGQLTNTGESITLESYSVEIFYGA